MAAPIVAIEEAPMSKANATMTVRKANELVSIIDIHGDINALAENVLMDAYTQASAGRVQTIILNFTELDHMNSSGISLLVVLLVRMSRQQQRLLAFGLSEHYRHILELTRLNEVIAIYETEIDALTATQAA